MQVVALEMNKSGKVRSGKMLKMIERTWNEVEEKALLCRHREANRRCAITVCTRKGVPEEFVRKVESACEGATISSQSMEASLAVSHEVEWAKKVCASLTSLWETLMQTDGKMCGQKECRLRSKTERCCHRQEKGVSEEVKEIPEGVQTAPPTTFPQTMRVGEVQVPVEVPPPRKQPLLIEHAAEVWEAASSSGAVPLSQILIREEHAANMIRQGTPLALQPKGMQWCLQEWSPVRRQFMKTSRVECVRPITKSEP